MENKGEILLYQAEDGQPSLQVQLENETVWLSQAQMTELFESSRVNITEHINNVFNEGELEKNATCRKFRQVRKEGNREVEREIDFYNLDVIISVGYRVKSKRGTQFRIWANNVLKNHLIKGYTLNDKLKQNQLNDLAQAVELFQKSYQNDELKLNEAKGLLDLITNYTRTFVLLNQFDSDNLPQNEVNRNITYEIQYGEARTAINQLKENLIEKKEASALFGNEKDDSFKGILGNIVQTFGGEYLYASIEEQAAHLLYFIIKNHSFSDGNKRIGSFLFVWFLERNNHRLDKKGKIKIDENTLVALALLVAQSNPDEKELMVKLIINLINQ